MGAELSLHIILLFITCWIPNTSFNYFQLYAIFAHECVHTHAETDKNLCTTYLLHCWKYFARL